MDDITVVSEIGEQWSPQTAPPKIAPITFSRRIVSEPPDALFARGMAMGKTIVMVAHDEPEERTYRCVEYV